MRFKLKTKSIQYVRPFFSKTSSGHDLNDRDSTFGGREDADYDPWEYGKGGDFNGDNFRKALYEDVRDRHNMEFANVVVSEPVVASGTEVQFYFKDLTDGTVADISDSAKYLSTKWGKDGANYVDGYVTIMGFNKEDDSNKVDQQLIA